MGRAVTVKLKGWAFCLLLFNGLLINTSFAAPTHKPDKASKTHTRKQRHPSSKNGYSVYNLSKQQIATLLGYRKTHEKCSLCGGYYHQPSIITETPNPLPISQQQSYITAQGPTIFNQSGESILQKHVKITQPGRMTTTDKAYVYRNRKTGRITNIQLVNHVHMAEYGRLIIAQKAHLNLVDRSATLHQAVYHIQNPALNPAKKTTAASQQVCSRASQDAWGRAKKAHRGRNDILKLWGASFTSCSPLSPAWNIRASRITIDKPKHTISAKNVLLKFKHIPILWAPYYSFTTNNQRKSGFLSPGVTYSKKNGMTFKLPFYFNLAPNYDDTFGASYFSERGVQMSNEFRYLTPSSQGSFLLNYLPNDRKFRRFKIGINDQFGTNPNSLYAPYVHRINTLSNNRFFGSFNNHSISANGRWKNDIQLNYVTDDYYFNDFGDSYSVVNSNQLFNQVSTEYSGLHWNVTGLLQGYQTLHPIDQVGSTTYNQYTRLPEFDVDAHYPTLPGGLDFDLSSQFVDFIYSSDFPPFTFQRPVGQRLHIRPGLSRPFYWSSGYLTPSIYVDNTTYTAKMGTQNEQTPRQDLVASRTIPIVDIDSGLYLSNDFHLAGGSYTQTFEPRVMYLYVPYVNQDDYPNFDTELLPFSFAQVFSLNRFTGYDRLENANQVSLGLTSRIIDDRTAQEKFKFNLGIIYYMENPRVNLDQQEVSVTARNSMILLGPSEANRDVHFSPLLGQVTFNPTSSWTTSMSAAYDFSYREMNNADAQIAYHSDNRHIVGLGYTYVKQIDGIPVTSLGQSTATNLIDLNSTWPITHRWSLFAHWYYNIALKRPNGYYAGLQYDSCCWAFRVIAKRTFTGVSSDSTFNHVINEYDNSYYVQLQLKGLGGLGNSDAAGFLQDDLYGYKDPFNDIV